ncbi:alpha-glucosidase [Pullulanibacillus sp. KACC 23026]|uniref:glycoside hydrolase family 13 protein n=1 Tax=Pullulanibacillus sp. KACC 23026 TaxID=3028315 RepID=UPI0023B1AF09|nr:alpha-glucosidase [Pullulanibacillus sp. KACC 23026]WEG13178.1 alpha-glucosidase [Pullulanibacillus sp. KACC 23026]
MKHQWWKEAIAYQIYPRSFMDSNGDGIGDIQGIISKLDYVKNLGIDVIWICPIFNSPNDDNGYDISDYKGIMAEFGTMADFDELLSEVHKRGMKLILDLVINHTSDEHPWFVESRSSKENPYRDYYIWKKGKAGKEPNNWESIFGGSAWKYDEATDEYFLHVFSTKQPDLNWENQTVRHELYDMINWWLDKGIDGFRVDAISHIKKEAGFPDLPNPNKKKYVPSFDGHMNRPGIQAFLKELKEHTFARYDIMTVGEANGVKIEEADEWVGEENGIFNMIFQFEHLGLWGKSAEGGLDIHALKKIFTKWQKSLDGKGWNALFLENHDQPRSVSTWGDDGEYREKSAKSLAALYFLMQGTPFIYQGQEIGMTNVQFDSIDDYNDVAIKNMYKSEREEGKSHLDIMKVIWKNGRDNSRTPMQWSDAAQAGFTTGKPWMTVNPNYQTINVATELTNPDSVYHFYKSLIDLRKDNAVLVYGSYDLVLENHDFVYAYTRKFNDETVLVLCNLFNEDAKVNLPKELVSEQAELLLSNYSPIKTGLPKSLTLNPFETRIYRLA